MMMTGWSGLMATATTMTATTMMIPILILILMAMILTMISNGCDDDYKDDQQPAIVHNLKPMKRVATGG